MFTIILSEFLFYSNATSHIPFIHSSVALLTLVHISVKMEKFFECRLWFVALNRFLTAVNILRPDMSIDLTISKFRFFVIHHFSDEAA